MTPRLRGVRRSNSLLGVRRADLRRDRRHCREHDSDQRNNQCDFLHVRRHLLHGVRSVMDAVSSWTPIVFIVPCPSPLPWEHGRSRDTLSGGIFSRRRRRGNKIGARGVPDSHSLKRHGRTRSCHATERSRLEERNTRTSCKRSRANSSFLPLMKRWLISMTKLSSARRSRRTAGQKMPHKQPPSHLPHIAGTCEKHRRSLNRPNP